MPVTTLNSGDNFYFTSRILNGEPAAQPVLLRWQLVGPCGQIRNFTSNESAPRGIWVREFFDTLPLTCAGSYTFTFTLTWTGNTTAQSTTFTMTGPTPTPTVLPTATTEPIVSLDSIWTADASGTPQSVFQTGETVRYYARVSNPTGIPQDITLVLDEHSACGDQDQTSLERTLPAGDMSYWLQEVVSDCAGETTFTVRLTWNGNTTEQSATFVVQGLPPTPTIMPTDVPGTIALVRVWTADANGVAQQTFTGGAPAQFFAELLNTTGSMQTVTGKWQVTGPCGTLANWAYQLDTDNGIVDHYLGLTLPGACPGNYTFSFTLTVDDLPVTETATFTVE